MGIKNYLIEGVSGAGKTSVCDKLLRRGYDAIHGDRDLAYQGDPKTGEPRDGFAHEHHIWDLAKVRVRVADQSRVVSFSCGGSRNTFRFLDLFDLVFVLEIGEDTLARRLAGRSKDEFGGKPAERDLIARLHASRDGVPKNAIVIDATRPLACVVEDILSKVG